MKVSDLMFTDLQVISTKSTVADAILTLAEAHVYGLPVLADGTTRLVGVLWQTPFL